MLFQQQIMRLFSGYFPKNCTNRLIARRQQSLIFLAIAGVIIASLFPVPLLARQSTKPENPYHLPAQWNLALNDPLKKNDGSWETSSSCKFAASGYQVSAEAKKNADCAKKNPNYSDFALEVNIPRNNGKGVYIVFRATDLDKYGYTFYIDKKGEYTIHLFDQDNENGLILADGTSAPIHGDPNQSNLLAVVARGNTFDLYVNHQFIRTVVDEKSTFDHGTIALGVLASDKKPGEASFSDLKVWTP